MESQLLIGGKKVEETIEFKNLMEEKSKIIQMQ
jgi:hypothetical protein